jgi:hypothetical protein
MLVILITFLLLIFIIYYCSIRLNTPPVIFLSSYQIEKLLNDEFYNYYNTMSDDNLLLRRIANNTGGVQTYLKNINKHFYDCNHIEKKILKEAIKKANKKINLIQSPGFYPTKLKKIPWIIGCSYGYDYEFGMPHTKNNIIILNNSNIHDHDLVTTLIHERIHIYQKMFPEDIEEYIKYHNFKRISKKTDTDRVNPDTDEFIYKKNNTIYECKIDTTSSNCKIICTKNNSKYEHPFEYMAYTLSEL